MKILSSSQIKQCDSVTIGKGISSIDLMERAAKACSDWIEINFKINKGFSIFCGNGNNGGDGFAIARMLYEKGFDIDVFIDENNFKFSDDSKINLDRIKKISGIGIKGFSEFENNRESVIIDALFGYGLNRELSDDFNDLIEKLNEIHTSKISIDIPTGLFADRIIDEHSTVFKADFTLTFQFYKRSFLHPETGRFCGKIIVLNIDLDEDFINGTKTDYFVIDETLIKNIYKPRKEFSHKGTYGKSILVGGSYGKIGAVLMSTLSALRTGSGLTFTIAPKCGNTVLQSQIPEAMFIDSGENHINKIEIQEKAVYGIGPGLGKEKETRKALLEFLENYTGPIVLDADAINILAETQRLNLIPENSVITPHPLEFERLFGKTENSFEKIELAKQKAEELQIFIILKDHHTAVVTPGKKVFYNITGNSGMAKGGSGDVLTGILTSLISQRYEIEEACIFGVWLHGKAGDLAAEEFSKEAMLPTDLINKIGDVFKYLS
ncbi:NAD(P)H-hydrate dehydratase [Epilithonimonas hungarica]|uniref:Bifunctional NAD(P)H-hydrate repair enzyme n=1 Tax=Epilithonimonas hungarica TaxID=454006 RepID=A0A1G7M112_9FLAO|nr:NAD(P)H-hydrate dehydratase [Epilithonimonas hungarica]SDF55326.1 NAD(P)H-hydrate epimerase [Epilithonimonas hungarica]